MTYEITKRLAGIFVVISLSWAAAFAVEPVRTEQGLVDGTISADGKVRIFRGIPFAAPPIGKLRWAEPRPAERWTGVRKATEFGPRCMQARVYDDMIFRDNGPSEDCLYLNVWTPAVSGKERLPVMVWIYGGGFAAGAASEPRQDGENLARKGVVVVSFNYRLGVFGFFSHPELTEESAHKASGNYGLLDQLAALKWVRKNVAAFGGNPRNVTIFGESAGSFSVSALMASPLSQSLFQKAIGESGAFFGDTLTLKPRAETEKADASFADSAVGKRSLDELRAAPANEILRAARKQAYLRFAPNIDGYFLPQSVSDIYAAGKQSHVPLLAGWNADESNYRAIFRNNAPTVQRYMQRIGELFGDKAGEAVKLYPAETDAQAKRSAQDLAGDQFIAYSTWKWLEVHRATSGALVYRYEFDQAPPQRDTSKESPGAYHSADIEFVFETLASKDLPWRPEDHSVSEMMATYWSNFAKTGDPNGAGLPRWPVYDKAGNPVMHLQTQAQVEPDQHRSRYEFLDSVRATKQ